jgi:crotonobetainyl-CoA:carnitine CoA-transferase CaiB-like acyl-CoA transferase
MELVRLADVVVDNFKPASASKLGVDHSSLRAANPRIVHCSISGFGGSGPGAGVPGYDLLVQALGGLMHLTGDPNGPPTKVGVALVDVLSGLYATIGLLAGLEHRRTTGTGCHVEIALFDVALASLVNQASGWLMADSDPGRQGNRHPSIAPYGLFEASDGPFVVAVGTDAQWKALVALVDPELGSPEWATNARRRNDLDELESALNQRFRAHAVSHWIESMDKIGVPCGPVNDLAAAFSLADALERQVVVEVEPGYRGVASPIIIDGDRLGSVRVPPIT